MKHTEQNASRGSTVSALAGGPIGIFLILGMLFAASAPANFEQVSTFAEGSETRQLLSATGMAVNTTGAGGVPAGTLYAVANGARVLRYGPKGEFREAWGWGVADNKAEFQRCGPDGEAAYPTCAQEIVKQPGGNVDFHTGISGEGAGQLSEPQGIAVDQATGNVYVVNGRNHKVDNVVQVFNATGSQLLTSFGDAGAPGETFDAGPEKFHGQNRSGIAVDNSGVVFVSDRKLGAGEEFRVMVFKPQSSGDYEHYVYAGRANDIAFAQVGTGPLYLPLELALDNAGNLYAGSEEAIYEFAPGKPATPICEFQMPASGIEGMTVDPASGEVFYFSEKNKKIHQLSACDAEGKFKEKAVLTLTPNPGGGSYVPLTFNPTFTFEVSRSAGTLYAADGGDRPNSAGGRGLIFAPAEVRSPVVESESVSSVGATTATLGAQINPKGSNTDYLFQYISKAAYEANEPAARFAGASEAPLGGATLGSGQVSLGAGVALAGLLPDTEYHFRAIATSHCEPDDATEACEGIGVDRTFRTFPTEAPGLADKRAYELVSPAQKHGGQVFPANPLFGRCGFECKPGVVSPPFPLQSAPDGEAVVYEGFPFSFTEGAVNFNEYLSKRNASGWQTTTLSPALMGGSQQGYKAFDAALSKGVLLQFSPSLTSDAPSEYPNLYSQPTTSPAELSPLIGSEPPNRTAVTSGAGRFEPIYAGASADFNHLFFAANDALTTETPYAPEAADGGRNKNNLYESVGGQLRLVNVSPGNGGTVPGAVFGSGKQLGLGNLLPSDFSHAISIDGSRVFWSDPAGQVYVRLNGETTKAIPDPGKFLSASADGSEVLLSNGDIYNIDADSITDLSEGAGGFLGILGQSEDLSHVYFVDTAVLTGNQENDQQAKAQPGKNNLYSWQEGSIVFVATLGTGDNAGDNAVSVSGSEGGDWRASPSERTAEASPSGRWLAFLSLAPLTGYDNIGSCHLRDDGEYESAPCAEAFIYDSATGQLRCASCNPSNARPLGRSNLSLIHFAEGSLPQPRYLTDSGRLYFDTQDSLTPFDTNSGVEDVYQYEPHGVGTCKREGGCVSLISAGHEPGDSNFLSMDETGANVFFTTRDQLTLKDRDDLYDLYDARENGGIGAETEVGRSECQGEACQSAFSLANDPTPGSSSFEGAGNVVEGKAKRKHKKHRHAKKHIHKRAANHNRRGGK